MEIIIPFVSLLVSLVNIFGIALVGLYLTMRSRTTAIFDKIISLKRELNTLRNQKDPNFNDIAELQLRIKHLMVEVFEMRKWRFPKLSQSQNRLMADCCESFLYFKECDQFWKECFSREFPLLEMESEYRRRYAQYLYHTRNNKKGDIEYKKALELPNDTDGRRYINIETYISWGHDLLRLMSVKCQDAQFTDIELLKISIADKFTQAHELKFDLEDAELVYNAKKNISENIEKYCPWVVLNE